MIQVGVDLVETSRIKSLLVRYGERFSRRIYTTRELEACRNHPERLAARFAAKEAVAKSLGTGIGPISWREIEVINDVKGKPSLVLYGAAAETAANLGLTEWAISLSHTRDQAIAFVVASS